MSIERITYREGDMAEQTAQITETVRDTGCVIVENACNADMVARLTESLQPWLQGEKYGRNNFEGFKSERVYALLAKTPEIAPWIEHPLMLGASDALLPEHYLLSAALVIKLHPGETEQGFHIDDMAGGFSHLMPRPMLGVSTIWALDDFTKDNGATDVVPGSHLWEAGRTPEPSEIETATMPAGSVLIFAGNFIHRGGANRSGGTRLGVTIQYCAPWMRQIESMLLAVPPHIARTYSQRIRELLGYSVVRPGFMGYVDGMHPAKALDTDYANSGEQGNFEDTKTFGLKI